MAIKRYNLNEVTKKLISIFYEHLAGNSGLTYKGRLIPCSEDNPTVAHIMHTQYNNFLNGYYTKILDYTAAYKNVTDKSLKETIEEQIASLNNEHDILSNLNLRTQKLIYKNSCNLRLSCSSVVIPINKLINSYYDDLSLEVLFYDDVCTPMGLFSSYIKLKTFEEKVEFIQEHTEITHMALIINKPGSQRPVALIILKGDTSKTEFIGMDAPLILPAKYGDFENLHLSDLNGILNNDIKQILQEKINLDNERLELLYEENIRGDVYKLYKHTLISSVGNRNFSTEYYVRYVCSSTGRVYYNKLILPNLALSDYYDIGDTSTYLRAWWNITHLGASVDGNPVISC